MDQTPGKGTSTSATPWGEGRIAFLAHKADIEARIEQGWPLAKIYKEFQDQLAGLSYPGFTRCIRHYAESAAPAKKARKPQTVTPPEKKALASPAISQPEPVSPGESLPKPFFQKGDRVPDIEKLI